MPKELACSDVGFDCDYEATAETEQELLGHVAEHAEADHDMETIPDDVLQKVKAEIRTV